MKVYDDRWYSSNPDGGPQHIEVQGALRAPGEWFACEQPERSGDSDQAFHDCCRACLIAARVEFVVGQVPLSMIEEMEQRLAEHGPAPRLDP